MNRQERLNDWYIRYHVIFGKRYSRKQKDRFLKSLTADILPYRQDINIDSFKINKKNKMEYRNLYIGDLNKANTVICTAYDTSSVRFSPYHFFDTKNEMRSAMVVILLTSLIYIAVGLLFTSLVAIPIFQTNGLKSLRFITCILLYIVYFYFLNKITKGWPRKNNLIQNTSSILLLLNCIPSFPSKGVAFAFVDGGFTNNIGLKRVLDHSEGKIYMLESIGSEHSLYLVNPNTNESKLINLTNENDITLIDNERCVYLISGEKRKNQFILKRKDLNKKELNNQNMEDAFTFLERIIRRGIK
ncbi:hypothetical protein [Fervidibacillus albus]|uniref:Uncharacterized protein n=1 Tax=Fervidibacillus albus TaxID=2980026 RepID=A0A9E8LTX5_9BACI|nr:hypothetical protein [Fervidibacillus albus]WAA09116.1 hypothetical protein OE104_11020 [Fervidibacillus albus]